MKAVCVCSAASEAIVSESGTNPSQHQESAVPVRSLCNIFMLYDVILCNDQNVGHNYLIYLHSTH